MNTSLWHRFEGLAWLALLSTTGSARVVGGRWEMPAVAASTMRPVRRGASWVCLGWPLAVGPWFALRRAPIANCHPGAVTRWL